LIELTYERRDGRDRYHQRHGEHVVTEAPEAVWLFAYAAAIAREPGVARGIKLFSEEISRDMSMLGICTLDEMHAGRLVRGERDNKRC
jgi:hypothetical protein